MADYVLTLGLAVLLAPGLLMAWSRARGSAGSLIGLAGRVVLVSALALPSVAIPTYYLTKSRSFQIAGELVRRVETDERVVALTFDDGPTSEYTEEVLRILDDGDAIATFYLTGSECEENPESLRQIIAAGHELGNHTYSHRRLYFVSGETVAREIERTDAIFTEAGYEAPMTFRMPGCKRLLTTPLYLSRTGRTTVTWDLEPDSLPGMFTDAEGLASNVVEDVRPGSIVLLHPWYESRQVTRDALPEIIERLRAEGYEFVTVSELLALR